ncbi:hypothetical protein HanRHA438_Chr04g0195621 [Helianthus annuus]|nr:hypothetical protein HanHA300_Chr04g0152271 [Helianthus annuus]KAJ0590682.1 hypothetical protein HanIR_Chr04g0200191 [Helianthus annuus]KAJ0598422.1 hypothetical protein HanHA89_Chr04g0165631 [Helianthus annuus]KAJ0759026.1 hypothetical protein HanLR1_Chr04g0156951 [Helianthus annuus]KAJ0762681.1 hypothetical protein HanOQP8_Chr04g0164031 [Helianthus annuus]
MPSLFSKKVFRYYFSFTCTCFFFTFCSKRDKASSVVAGYDTTRKPRYDMAGYTPIGDRFETGLDDNTSLSPKELMDIIHSRKTPTFWETCSQEIIFYCKLCSCFGIDYHCLEAASEDDVCLMNMGRNG